MSGIGSYTDGAGVPRPTRGVRLVDASGAPKDLYMSSDSEVFTTNTEREYSCRIRLVGEQSSALTAYMGLIDLSNAGNSWPHIGTDRLDFTSILVAIDKAAGARGYIRAGIITRIDGTSADITWIATLSFLENDTPALFTTEQFSPSQLKCGVVGGKLTNVFSSDKSAGVAAVNTGVPLAFGTSGVSFTPAVGDCLVQITTTTGGSLRYTFAAFYHGHPIPGA